MTKKIIYEELLKLKGGVHTKGFEYIVSAVNELYNNPSIGTIALYDLIAKEHNDTRARVERVIRYYIHKCIIPNGDEKEIAKLNLTNSKTGVPTVSEFLKAFTIYLKINY